MLCTVLTRENDHAIIVTQLDFSMFQDDYYKGLSEACNMSMESTEGIDTGEPCANLVERKVRQYVTIIYKFLLAKRQYVQYSQQQQGSSKKACSLVASLNKDTFHPKFSVFK